MVYRYYTAGSPVTFYSTKDIFRNDFQSYLADQFYYAPNVYTIKKEYPFASGSYVNQDVRITTAIDNGTGIKLPDDYKSLLFKTDSETPTLGTMFYIEQNYWLVVATDDFIDMSGKATIRRCNNVLKWRSSSGEPYSEPCIIDYKLSTPNNKSYTDPVIPEGTIQIISQLNARTATIQENQRFLFGRPGQWVCFRVYGGGLSNFQNTITNSNTSAKLLQLALGKSFENEDTDDLVNGIADYYKYAPEVSGSATVASIQILPVTTDILQGTTGSYTCYLVSGSSLLPNAFTFTAGSGVPTANYALTTLSSNSFSVQNIKLYMDAPLIITCASGSSTRNFSINLQGAW